MILDRREKTLFVFLPSYLDGESVRCIITDLDALLRRTYPKLAVKFIVIDESLGLDVKLNAFCDYLNSSKLWKEKVIIRRPPFRSGNQGAILWAINSMNWNKENANAYVAILDSDGEDSPEDLPRLLNLLIQQDLDLVYAKRGKRYSNLPFMMGKFLYASLFRLLTGSKQDGGNFSVMKLSWLRDCLRFGNFSHSFVGELTHLAAKKGSLRCDRKPRWDGVSKTNFRGLIMFGIRQLIPWSEVIVVRSFVFFILSIFSAASFSFFAFSSKFFFEVATPAWTTLVIGFSFVFAMLAFLLFMIAITVVVQLDSTKRIVRLIDSESNK